MRPPAPFDPKRGLGLTGLIALMAALVVISAFGPAPAAETKPAAQPRPAAGEATQAERDPIMGLVIMADETGLPAGSEQKLVLMIGVRRGFHLNSDQPPLDFLTPTKITFDPSPAVKVTEIVYPEPVKRKFPFAKEELPVFEKMVPVQLTLAAAEDATPGRVVLSGVLAYQACTDTACLPPAEKKFAFELTIAPAARKAPPAGPTPAPPSGSASTPSSGSASTGLESGLDTGSWWWLFLSVFLGGLALNLTPCCYPLIPITIAYFGGQSRSRAALLAHGGAYLLGLMAAYTALGTFAALSGRMLGAALQHPLTIAFVVAVLLALAGSMLGFYEFRLPAAVSRLGGVGSGKRGLFGSLVMGLSLGIVAAPCLGPLTLGVLTFVAQSGDPLVGAAVFGALSFGLGLPLAVLGLVSSKVRDRLPASGPWLEWVRRLLGAVMIVMAAYLARPLMAETAWYWLMAGTAVLGALIAWLGGRDVARWLKTVVTVGWVLLAVFFVLSSPLDYETGWSLYTPERLAAARGKAVVLDFYADWCAPCRELAKTLADPRIEALLAGVVTLKVDLTDWKSDKAEALRKKFRIQGVPTLVFIGPDGRERSEFRVVGAAPAEFLIDHLKRFLAAIKGG